MWFCSATFQASSHPSKHHLSTVEPRQQKEWWCYDEESKHWHCELRWNFYLRWWQYVHHSVNLKNNVGCLQFLPKFPWITESFAMSVYVFLTIPVHSPSSHHDRLPSPSHWHNYCAADINPLPPLSDRDRISPYNINTISSIEVMRIT